MKIKIGKYPKKSDAQRKVKIQVSDHDVWAADSTLALIIVPMLKKVKESKQGSPLVDDEDVPEGIRSTNADPKEHEWDIDSNHHARWTWVLDEMIWAFEQHIIGDWEEQYFSGEPDYIWKSIEGSTYKKLVVGPNDTFKIDREGLDRHRERMANGRRLFAKYYEGLWT